MKNFRGPPHKNDSPAEVAQFCIYSFCKDPEYHERLRAEAVECKGASFGSLKHEMPYLDSFVKETVRLSLRLIRKPSGLPQERGDRSTEF